MLLRRLKDLDLKLKERVAEAVLAEEFHILRPQTPRGRL